jgi:drug/metabolite transporter (DMT)-like permease
VWELLQRYRRIALASTVGLVVVLLACVLTWGDPVPGTPYHVAGMSLRAVGAWLGLAAALGFAGQHLERDSALRSRANEAVLVVYILHQTVLVTVGFFVLRWPIPDPAKYVIILVSSIAIVAGLYEGVVRRWNIMRFLFGMKPRAAAVVRQPVAQPAALPDPA